MAAEISNLSTILSHEEEKILACVHCGLCLEACPTYVATGDENDGPRGRIYLMRAVKEERLAPDSPAFRAHIDRCLGCRACESACPAGVQYGQLLESARAEILQGQTKPRGAARLLQFILKYVWPQPALLRASFAMARIVRDLRLADLLIKTGIARGISTQFEFALALLDASRGAAVNKESDTARMTANPDKSGQDARAPALLFKGCVMEGLFEPVNAATRRVLEINGSEVRVPPAQVCCGALHAHAGDLAGARALAKKNIDAFGEGDTPIVTNAGGCGAMLVSYAHLFAHDAEYAERARQFSARIRDIGQQLHASAFRNGANIGFERTTYDASCHLLHGQHAADASLQMLWAIPDLNFTMLNGSDVCCGGAGVYNLMQPELSDEVLAEKLSNIEQSGAKILATGNPGCHMQIAAGARLAKIPLRVCHPVELLDESYARAGFYDKS